MNWLTQSVGDIARGLPGATGYFCDILLKITDGQGAAAHG